MSILGIILLILLGVLLFLVEFFIIPGVTLAGIGGAVLFGLAVFIAYRTHGTAVGNYTLLATLIISITAFIIALRARTWRRFMLKTNIDSKVEVGLEDQTVKPGDRGETVTRLAPIGMVRVNDITIEGKSIGGFLDPNTKVEVVKVLGTQIIVKPINKE
jgi:membrane-bound ClpP family serine protease